VSGDSVSRDDDGVPFSNRALVRQLEQASAEPDLAHFNTADAALSREP
jgi:hypothetical protein